MGTCFFATCVSKYKGVSFKKLLRIIYYRHLYTIVQVQRGIFQKVTSNYLLSAFVHEFVMGHIDRINAQFFLKVISRWVSFKKLLRIIYYRHLYTSLSWAI
ncbi:hypothetical protein GpSGHVEth017 [Glossina pallidipes salivary gland hypertrophy virus]|uniref:Uncharacterized protein n=1 Tax=Glossina hytrovirus (isolate Glossina pallidipes/Ethiopia/Seibersdorf/-) TaxID=379529 RepID=A0A0Y0KBA4_GHVS|nr:hypothetical protein GpSGHVEth017 [Glossina pallidipes salivary gland hypertrophy virus]